MADPQAGALASIGLAPTELSWARQHLQGRYHSWRAAPIVSPTKPKPKLKLTPTPVLPPAGGASTPQRGAASPSVALLAAAGAATPPVSELAAAGAAVVSAPLLPPYTTLKEQKGSKVRFPVPGTAIREDEAREKLTLTAAKVQAALNEHHEAASGAFLTRLDALVGFELAQYERGFGAAAAAVAAVLEARVEAAEDYAALRKEVMPTDPAALVMVKEGRYGALSRGFELGTLNPNACDPVTYNSALMKAVSSCQTRIVQLFIANGADPNQENKYGQVPLHYAWDAWLRVKSDSIFKTLKLMHTITIIDTLLAAGANPNKALPDDGRTVLHIAASFGQAAIVKLLLLYHADPEFRDDAGFTALDYAEQKDFTEVAGMLRNWHFVADEKKSTMFRSKWRAFLAKGQHITSKVDAAQFIEELAWRDKSNAHHHVTEVTVVPSEVELPVDVQMAAARLLAGHPVLVNHGSHAEFQDGAMVIGRRSSTGARSTSGTVDMTAMKTIAVDKAQLQEKQRELHKKAVSYDYKKRLRTIVTGEEVEEIGSSSLHTQTSVQSPAVEDTTQQSPGRRAAHTGQAPPAAVAPQGSVVSDVGSAQFQDEQEDEHAAAAAAAEVRLNPTDRRRRLAARSVAEDAYADQLSKSYPHGETYVRKSALKSAVLRGSHQISLVPKGAQEDDTGSARSRTSGGRGSPRRGHDHLPSSRFTSSATIPPPVQRSAAELRSFCDNSLLPTDMVVVEAKSKVQLRVEREAAMAEHLSKNKYDVLLRKLHATRLEKYGEMEDPWKYAKYKRLA